MNLDERTPPSESLSKEFCRLRNFRVDHLRNYYIAISDLRYGRFHGRFQSHHSLKLTKFRNLVYRKFSYHSTYFEYTYARIKLSVYETKIRFVAASQGFVRTLFPISMCRIYQGNERR